MSPKVQTTRARVLGIALDGPAQIIWVDTPGIFQPRRRLERAMVATAWKGPRMPTSRSTWSTPPAGWTPMRAASWKGWPGRGAKRSWR